MTQSYTYRPATAFSDLGDEFSDIVAPADFPQAQLRYWNGDWAARMGLGDLSAEEKAKHFHAFAPLPDNQAEPRALRYHGHQFRQYNPQIGDGRGFLLGQLYDAHDRLLDLGTKGSGQTPYSRQGDGRLTLKGAVREILATEMLEALGVYTSKTLAVFETGEALHRGDEPSPTRSAVMTRLQHSHVRFGMFQRHAYYDRPDLVERLMEYAITHFYPAINTKGPERAAHFLDQVCETSARLAAQWMAAGFVHGVLNTDNLVVTGESFDYGPWRFLPTYEPGFTAAYFDETGLYAYARQPESVFWALQQLAGALSLVGERESLIAALQRYPDHYKSAVRTAFHHRLGVAPTGEEAEDGALITYLLDFMKEAQVPFEALFFDWFCGSASEERAMNGPRAGLYQGEAFEAFHESLMRRTPVRPERLDHAYFNRDDPLSMVIETVEGLWAPIHERDDWSVYERTLETIGEVRQAYDLGHERVGFRG